MRGRGLVFFLASALMVPSLHAMDKKEVSLMTKAMAWFGFSKAKEKISTEQKAEQELKAVQEWFGVLIKEKEAAYGRFLELARQYPATIIGLSEECRPEERRRYAEQLQERDALFKKISCWIPELLSNLNKVKGLSSADFSIIGERRYPRENLKPGPLLERLLIEDGHVWADVIKDIHEWVKLYPVNVEEHRKIFWDLFRAIEKEVLPAFRKNEKPDLKR